MENPNSFYEAVKDHLLPTLEHMAAVQISVTLLSSDYTKLFKNGKFYKEKAWTKISELSLPEVISSLLKPFVSSVAAEIKRWVSRMIAADIFNCEDEALWYLDHVVFSSRGSITYEETGRNLLRDVCLTPYVKFRISCYYCLEEEVLSRSAFSFFSPEYRGEMKVSHRPEVFYFNCVIKQDYEPLDEQIREVNIGTQQITQITRYRYLTCLSMMSAWPNPALLKYVWSKMNDQERCSSMLHFMKNVAHKCPALLLDLFSGSGETVVQTVLEYEDLPLFGWIVGAFLQDPLYLEFVPSLILKLGNLMTNRSFREIFLGANRKKNRAEVALIYDSYVRVYEQIWCSVEEHFKLDVCECQDFDLFFSNLLENGKLIFIKKILTDIGGARRYRLLFSDRVLNVCVSLIKSFKRKTFDSFFAYIYADGVFTCEDIMDFREKLTDKFISNIRRKHISAGTFKGIMQCLGDDDEVETEHRHFVRICEVIWTAAPKRNKIVVFEDGEVPLKMVRHLLRIEEFTFAKKILDGAGNTRSKLICSTEILTVCISWVKDRKWELLNSFTQQCLVSSAHVGRFKEALSLELYPAIYEFGMPTIGEFERWNASV